MKTLLSFFAVIMIFLSGNIAFAMQGHEDNGKASKATDPQDEMGFKHNTVVDGVRSEFQIMSLASMKMKDEQGKTHHIMVKLYDDDTNAEIENAVGKIKIISPDGSEQIGLLKNYGGIFAANFNFPDNGKYGIICLLKVENQKKIVKFWYSHNG